MLTRFRNLLKAVTSPPEDFCVFVFGAYCGAMAAFYGIMIAFVCS